MAKNSGMRTSDVVSIVTLTLVVVTLILGLTGQFGEITGSGNADNSDNGNTANAPADNNNAGNNAGNNNNGNTANNNQPGNDTNNLAVSTWEDQLEGTYIRGDEDAPVSIIEFSDVECPFCQRHFAAGTIETTMQNYDEGQVNHVYMHFPLSFHTSAQKAGEALECAGDLQGEEGFWNFHDGIYEKGGKPTLDVIENTASETGFDTEAFMECVNSGKFAQKVKNQMAFGRSVGVTGTPGNVVVDNDTGDYIVVSGAVPASSFYPAIDQFLNQ